MAERRTAARDLKPGDWIVWNGVTYAVEHVHLRAALYISGGAQQAHVKLAGRPQPIVVSPDQEVLHG